MALEFKKTVYRHLSEKYIELSGGKGHGGMEAASVEQKGVDGVESFQAPFVVE